MLRSIFQFYLTPVENYPKRPDLKFSGRVNQPLDDQSNGPPHRRIETLSIDASVIISWLPLPAELNRQAKYIESFSTNCIRRWRAGTIPREQNESHFEACRGAMQV